MFGGQGAGLDAETKSVTISANVNGWNLISQAYGGVPPTKKQLVTITINTGIAIGSTTTASPAMDLTGLPANSVINLTNNGNIIGKGGNGGAGGFGYADDQPEEPCDKECGSGTDGGAGGDAIKIDGTNVDLNVTNANGYVFGGGGGGGGATGCVAVSCGADGGNGGGGGAGGGSGGNAGGISGNRGGAPGEPGTAGTSGISGIPGTGGADLPQRCGTLGVGGNGGAYGAAGGTATESFGTCSGGDHEGVGGAAGKAVSRPTGTGTTTFLSGGDSSRLKGAAE